MEIVGTVATVIAAIIVLIILIQGIRLLPDVARYLRIRKM
jgi:hypothetical protein